MSKLASLHGLAMLLVVVGALNWGLISVFDFDLITAITAVFGGGILTKVAHVLIGLSAVYIGYSHYCSGK